LWEPCPFPKLFITNNIHDHVGKPYLEETQVCPKCYEKQRRWTKKNGLERSSYKEMIQRMETDYNGGKLKLEEIAQLQLDEEGIFNVLKQKAVETMDDTELENHYYDILRKMEMFRVRALRYKQLKVDFDIEQMSKVSDEDRAAFEEAKRKRKAENRPTPINVAAVRQSKEQKMIQSFAEKIMAGHPEMTREEALERATKMFA
jgi:hypothetical protein